VWLAKLEYNFITCWKISLIEFSNEEHVARRREKMNEYRLLMGKPEGKTPLGRPRRMWVDNIRIDLGEVG
jgi:hypothetical protein